MIYFSRREPSIEHIHHQAKMAGKLVIVHGALVAGHLLLSRRKVLSARSIASPTAYPVVLTTFCRRPKGVSMRCPLDDDFRTPSGENDDSNETFGAVEDSAESYGLVIGKPVGALIGDFRSGDLVEDVREVALETVQAGKDSARMHLSVETDAGSDDHAGKGGSSHTGQASTALDVAAFAASRPGFSHQRLARHG